MKIQVVPPGRRPLKDAQNTILLITDGWDDWFKFNTMYNAFYYDEKGDEYRVGEVKIGQFQMRKEQKRPDLPREAPDGLGDDLL